MTFEEISNHIVISELLAAIRHVSRSFDDLEGIEDLTLDDLMDIEIMIIKKYIKIIDSLS